MLYQHNAVIAPGAEYLIDARGDFVRYREGVSGGAKTIVVRTSSGAEVAMAEGDDFKLPQAAAFNQVRLHNPGTDAIAVRLLVGFGVSGGTPRISFTDAATERVTSGLQHGAVWTMAGDSLRTAQLWNGGSRILVVTKATGLGGLATTLWARNTQLTAGTAITLQNRLAGVAAPSGISLTHKQEAAPYTAGAGSIEYNANTASGFYLGTGDAPIALPPGWGLSMQLPSGTSVGAQKFGFEAFVQ